MIGESIISYKFLNFHPKFPESIELQQIKIKEVSSHFTKGWFYLCLIAKEDTNEENCSKIELNDTEKEFQKFHEVEKENKELISCEKSEKQQKMCKSLIKYQKIKAEEIMPLVIPHLVVRSKKKKMKLI